MMTPCVLYYAHNWFRWCENMGDFGILKVISVMNEAANKSNLFLFSCHPYELFLVPLSILDKDIMSGMNL